MKLVMHFFIVCLLSLIVFTSLAVQAADSGSAWESYQGVSQWRVDVTEDESGCGGGKKVHSVLLQLQHDKKNVGVGDWGHGLTQGTFDGNALHVPERTIPDGAGRSRLYAFDVTFTVDCSSFGGAYRWDYRDSQQSCSGSTSLRGTRTDGAGCPEKSLRTEVNENRIELNKLFALRQEEKALESQAWALRKEDETSPTLKKLNEKLNRNIGQIEELQPKVEGKYRKMLNKDPNNFWANWDMAELEKNKGNYKAYFDYFDRAASTLDPNTNSIVKKKVADDLGLSDFPTIVGSPFVQKISDNAHNLQGGRIYDVTVQKDEPTNWEKFKMKLQSVFDSKNYVHNVVDEIVGLPPETK